MLPAERGDVADQLRRDGLAAGAQDVEGGLQVAGVPEDDGRNEQVQPGGAVGLVLEGSVAQFAEAMEEHGPGERVAGLALVQAGVGAPAQVAAAEPVEGYVESG